MSRPGPTRVEEPRWQTLPVPSPSPLRWGVVVPVKRLDLAKTRLRPYDDGVRRALALAMAEDVVDAACAAAGVVRVLAVCADAEVREALARRGATVVLDEPDDGLDAALRHGAQVLRDDDPGLGVAALAADLPALRPEDLAAALLQVAAGRCGVVADAPGSGTSLLAAPPGLVLAPAYGPGSFARHRAAGARPLAAADGLRRDVDTPEDLAAALRLGVGPRTAAVAAGLA
ncbi:MAG: cofC [Frankiales bacterium]|nr:cofC [Frankiales bacterium]